jgi:coproporphyrinogen III oxidase-like Fe-S oxidoreductase
MGLRLTEGIDPARYQALTGRSLDAARIAVLAREGLIANGGAGLQVTSAGFPVLDSIITKLAA